MLSISLSSLPKPYSRDCNTLRSYMKPRTGTAAGSGSSTGRGRHGGGQQGRRAESPAAAAESQSPLRSPLPVQAGMRAASQVQPARASESPADHRHGAGHDGGGMERTSTRVRM